jgi:hypothetical protein
MAVFARVGRTATATSDEARLDVSGATTRFTRSRDKNTRKFALPASSGELIQTMRRRRVLSLPNSRDMVGSRGMGSVETTGLMGRERSDMGAQLARIRRAYDRDPERECAWLKTGAQNRLEFLIPNSEVWPAWRTAPANPGLRVHA